MNSTSRPRVRCAVYTRKSSEEGLEQSFNSLQAQREACESYIASQLHEGWQVIKTLYDDGGFSGGTMERPALRKLLDDIAAGNIDTVVVYKVDRLTRSLADFAKIVEAFDRQGISFVSVTQQFNTTTSMGRLTLNVLLSFAQFERDVTGERIRDKVAASKKKGMWMGGPIPLGYELRERQLFIHADEAKNIRHIFAEYVRLGCVSELKQSLDRAGMRGKVRTKRDGSRSESSFSRGALYSLLANRLYIGEIVHRGQTHPGQHQAIIERPLWDKVAAQLAENRRTRRQRGRKQSPALLTGLLFDEQGERYTPTHALKKGRRYRYYTSQAVIQGKETPPSVKRISARELDQIVLRRLSQFLNSPRELLQLLEDGPASVAETSHLLAAAKARSFALGDASQESLSALLSATIDKIVFGKDSLEICVSTASIKGILLGRQPRASSMELRSNGEAMTERPLSLTCELKVARKSLDHFLVLGTNERTVSNPSVPLIKAVARANSWMNRLVSGEVSTLDELASESGFTRRYVSRTLRAAFVSPQVTEMILDGLQPHDLTVRRMMEGFPADWRTP